ncbi:unnamed protein product [Prorocentrum cordatum]|uniref:Uncharacterized protein n=1 Tax=Prorocentrum cordatum TaxID=2364126 RepID=A0ABN9PVM2_9DINO|nr:unnamed protein product [Polarella glacialis]
MFDCITCGRKSGGGGDERAGELTQTGRLAQTFTGNEKMSPVFQTSPGCAYDRGPRGAQRTPDRTPGSMVAKVRQVQIAREGSAKRTSRGKTRASSSTGQARYEHHAT